MALETLKGVESIGGFDVLSERPMHGLQVDWALFDEQRKTKPIFIDHDVNMISFRIQDGPVKEHGVNGCQVDTLIHAAAEMLGGLQAKFPSKYNEKALGCLYTAIEALEARTADREKRGVEGTSQA